MQPVTKIHGKQGVLVRVTGRRFVRIILARVVVVFVVRIGAQKPLVHVVLFGQHVLMFQLVYLRADQCHKFQTVQFNVQRKSVVGEVDVVAHTARVQVVERSHLRRQALFIPVVQIEHREVVVDR